MAEVVIPDVVVHVGGQRFGSGGYTAGYKVLSGEVREDVLGEVSTNFVEFKVVRLRPTTDRAKVEFWAYDVIKDRGPNGAVTLVREFAIR